MVAVASAVSALGSSLAERRRPLDQCRRLGAVGDRVVRPVVEHVLRPRPSGESQCPGIVAVELLRLGQEADGFLAIGLPVRREVRQGAERQVVGGEALRALAAGERDLGHVDRGADGAGDPLGDVILEVEEVLDDTVVAVGPEMRPGSRRRSAAP